MRERPSFTDEIKAELANVLPARPCCQHAELAAIVGVSGQAGEGSQVTLRLSRNAVARKVVQLANDRIVRGMRGDANRRANSETANLDKRLRAAFEQVQRIRRLARQRTGLRALPAALRETADLRLAHPRAGLQELADRAHLSKSAMAHRLRRLMERAPGNGLIPSAGH